MELSYLISDNFLTKLDLSIWFIQLTAFIAFYYVAKRQQRINSSLISISVVLAISAIMLGYEAFINANTDPDNYNSLISFAWYIGFAALDALCILMIVEFHRLLNQKIGKVGRVMGLSHLILGLLQVTQYTEILLTDSDKLLEHIYPASIIAINLSTTLAVLTLGLIAAKTSYKNKFATEKLKWNI